MRLSDIWSKITRRNQAEKESSQPERSSKYRDRITAWECDYITKAANAQTPSCPDCQRGFLCMGPEGPGAVNCYCNFCGTGINIFYGLLDMSQRITDASPNFEGKSLEEIQSMKDAPIPSFSNPSPDGLPVPARS